MAVIPSSDTLSSEPITGDFDEEFGVILDGTLQMFILDEANVPKDEDGTEKPADQLNDIETIFLAEEKVKEAKKRSKDLVDQARNDLRALSREYQQKRNTSTRSTGHPTAEEHELTIATAQATRLARLKQNAEMEQNLYRSQAELERLQQELREEEADAVEVTDLNSDILRIKMYRDLGFIPVEQNGIFTKVLVRSINSPEARTIQLDSKCSDYIWSNLLWDQLGA